MHQCKRFSTDQWARTLAAILAAFGAKLLMYSRCSCVVLAPEARTDSITEKDFNPGHCSGFDRQFN